MASTQYQDAVPAMQQQTPSQAGYVMQQQQQKAIQQQQSDARTAKRIKMEHGEEQGSLSMPFPSPSASPTPSPALQQTLNGQERASGNGSANAPIFLPSARPQQQMGPPLNSRPPTSATTSYNNGEVASPAANSAAHSPSPQPASGSSRSNAGPGRVPYQFGMGLPTPGINFTRTPTTGSFVANNSNSNSRQQTPTDTTRAPSRASPSETKAAPPAPSPAPAPSSSTNAAGPRRDGVDVLQDLLSISGVDIRAEEEAAQRNSANRTSYNTATTAATQAANHPQLRQTAYYLELYPLSRRIQRIAAKHGLRVEPEVLTYLSLAAKSRFQNLLEAMVASSRHRTWSSHLRPPPLYERSGQAMYHEEIHDDPQKLLSALTRVEKKSEQDARQARLQREEMDASSTQAGPGGEDGGGKGEGAGQSGHATPAERGKEGEDGKKKAKKPGSSATAKNMSEDKRLKLANKTAAQALGISTNSKAWMFGAGGGSGSGSNTPFGSSKAGGSRLPKPRFAPVAGSGKGEGENEQDQEGGGAQGGGGMQGGNNLRSGSISVGGWGDLSARQRLKEEEERQTRRRVNLQDALHALEMERGGGAGRGSGEEILYACHALGRPPVRKL